MKQSVINTIDRYSKLTRAVPKSKKTTTNTKPFLDQFFVP